MVRADGFIDDCGHDLSSESFLPEPRARLSGQYCPRLTRDEEDREARARVSTLHEQVEQRIDNG